MKDVPGLGLIGLFSRLVPAEQREQWRREWEADRRRTPPPTPRDPATHGAPRGPLGEDGAGMRLDFGRYEGWTLGEVVKRDPEYLDWLRRHGSGARYRDAIDILLRSAR